MLTAGAAPAGETVRLEFKHPAGRIQRFRSVTTGTMRMTALSGPQANRTISMTLSGNTVFREKVVAPGAGGARVDYLVEAARSTMDALGRRGVVTLRNGKFVKSGDLAPNGPESVRVVRLTFNREGSGFQRLERAPASAGSRATFVTVTPLAVPDRPVSVGESWETTQQLSLDSRSPAAELRMRHALRELRQVNGKQIAVIESSGATTGGATAIGMHATTRFDVGRGAIAGGELRTSIRAGGLGRSQAQLDTTIVARITELPNVSARGK